MSKSSPTRRRRRKAAENDPMNDQSATPPHEDEASIGLLQALLHPNDVQKLRDCGQDPAEHTSLALDAAQVQTSPPQPDGSYHLNIVLAIPAGLFKEKSRLIVVGPSRNPLDDILGAVPTVTLPVRIDRLSEATIEVMEQQAAAMFSSASVEVDQTD